MPEVEIEFQAIVNRNIDQVWKKYRIAQHSLYRKDSVKESRNLWRVSTNHVITHLKTEISFCPKVRNCE